ncbi:MAG: hypothetical protein D9V47_06920 [Clostridia bacterium]|nr:MAG: hypothetical protein D9V47_06920 [Clostridia bacterium]
MPGIPRSLIETIQERLPFPATWEPEKTRLETWTSGRKVWKVSWQAAAGGSQVHLWTDVDAATEEIIGLTQFGEGEGVTAPPRGRCTREEALAQARETLTRVYPAKALQVELAGAATGDDGYRFFFRRLVNGIPFDPDGFEVTVEGTSGLVREVQLEWSNTVFPSPDNIITLEEASQCFLERFPLQLMYCVPVKMGVRSMGLDDNDELEIQWSPHPLPGERSRRALRVYAPAYSFLFSQEPFWQLDAFTGRLIDTGGRPVDHAAIKRRLLHPAKGVPANPKAKKKLNREEALRRVQPVLDFLGGEYEVVKAQKTRMSGDQNEIWELQLAGEAGDVQVRLDRLTGEIWSLENCANQAPENISSPPAVSRMQAAARRLLELCLPERYAQLVAADYVLPEDYREFLYGFRPSPGEAWGQAFTFVETVNGLPVTNNLATVILAGHTGQIQSFGFSRVPEGTEFPDPDTAMPPEAAVRRYLEATGIELAYVRDWWGEPGEPPAARLVYRVKPSPSRNFSIFEPSNILFLDACTGEPIKL